MASFPHGRALVVGVSVYTDPRWNVPTALRDAEELYRTLVDPNLSGYDERHVRLLQPEQTTRAGVLAALGSLADTATTETFALVSFTCHGALDATGLYCLATSDTQFTDNPERPIVPGTGLSVSDLAEALRSLRSPQTLLLVNACFAGHIGERVSATDISAAPELPLAGQPLGLMLPDEARAELLGGVEGRAIVSAGRAGQRSYYRQGAEHSYFGQALIDGLRGGEASRFSGYVGLFELYDHLFTEVRAGAARVGLTQEPALTIVQGVGPFAVASYRGATRGDPRLLRGSPPPEAPVNRVPLTVNITKRSLISFDGATIGSVSMGRHIEGDLVIIRDEPEQTTAPPDPLRQLEKIRQQVEIARNVDVEARDDAAYRINQARSALLQSDRERALRRIEEALALLRAMGNPYIDSAVRKLERLLFTIRG